MRIGRFHNIRYAVWLGLVCGFVLLHTAMFADTSNASTRKDANNNAAPRWTRDDSLLYGAAEDGQQETVVILLQAGANPNAINDVGDNALHGAAKHRQLHVVEYLLTHGARVNAHGHLGFTALHYASQNNDLQMINLLLRSGANVSAVNQESLSPIRYATSDETRNLLIDHGAVIDAPSMETQDNKACKLIEKLAKAGKLDTVDKGSAPEHLVRDPLEEWDDRDSLRWAEERVVSVNGNDYLLGSYMFPRYLARIASDQVESIVCEFDGNSDGGSASIYLMSDMDQVERASKELFISYGHYALKHVGLRKIKALVAASHQAKSVITLSGLSHNNILSVALSMHRHDVFRYLLEEGVDPNLRADGEWAPDRMDQSESERFETPLYTAVKMGTLDDVKQLLALGAEPNSGIIDHSGAGPSPLEEAVRVKDNDKVLVLLKHGATRVRNLKTEGQR